MCYSYHASEYSIRHFYDITIPSQPKSSEAQHPADDRVLLYYLKRYRDLGLQLGGRDNFVTSDALTLPTAKAPKPTL
jgi:hypothetical protein